MRVRGLIIVCAVVGCGSPSDQTGRRSPDEPRTAPASEAPSAPLVRDLPAPDPKQACLDRWLPAHAPRFHALVRSLCAEWVNQAVPGIAAAVVEDGELVFHLELGVRCVGHSEPVEPSTAFRVGSISKSFTATMLLETVGAGGLDQPVSAWLPDLTWPRGMRTPSLRELLQHHSGLGEIEPEQLVAYTGDWRLALQHSPAGGEPGAWRYSNAGYVVVGAVLEAASGRDYEALLHERASALGLDSITSDPRLADLRGAACGHLREKEGPQPIPVANDLDFMPGDPSWLRPTGGVLSSAEHLARFATTLDERMLEVGPPSKPGESYGLGLHSTARASGVRVFGHSGDTGSFSSELLISADRRTAVVLLANTHLEWASALAAANVLFDSSRHETR